MENNNRPVTNVFPGNSSSSWANDKLGPDLFEEQNFSEDSANGTTKEVFDRRNVIDRKNLVEIFIGRLGIKWVSLQWVSLLARSAFRVAIERCNKGYVISK